MSVVVLGARGQRSTNVRPEVSFTFDGIVALFDPNVVSYWKFQNTGTDQEGVSNATINGSPELNVPTIVKSDSIEEGAPVDGTCIAWPGTAGDYAEAAHNAAHKTLAGTVVVYFQRDSAAQKSQLIMADQAPVAAGGMAIGVTAVGAIDAHIRGTGGTAVTLIGGAGDVQLDRAYALIFKWGTGGGMRLALWDDTATLVRFATNTGSTIGLSGTSPIRFGATHTDTNGHDGPYARVLWLNRRITDLEEATLAQAFSIARSAGPYRQLELSMGPLSLWGLGENSGITILDSVGVPPRNGTYAGTVLYNAVDLPADSIDGSITFVPAGTGSGTVPASGLSLPVFSLSFWFRANTIPDVADPALPLITKNSAVAVAGDFFVYLPPSDGTQLIARFRDAPTVQLDIATPLDTIQSGLPYHVCVRTDSSGFDLFVNGIYYGKNTVWTGAWATNPEPLRFATSPTFTATGDCVLDEIALFNRVLTVPEVLQLAQRSGIAPVANDDISSVPEQAVTPLLVLSNDSFVGEPTIDPAGLTQPGGPDSVAIVPAAGGARAFLNYTAGNVTVSTVRSFNYRIIDPNGVSNTASVDVTVIADDTVVASNANCYVIGTATANVSSMADLELEVNAALPGDNIVINNGTYAGGTLNFNVAGTAANPIIIRGQTRAGVHINGGSWTLAGTSARIVITNMNFHNGHINVRGTHHRITRCRFDQANRRIIQIFNATDLRCDHCDFSDYIDIPPDRTNTNVRRFFDLDSNFIASGALKRVLFDYNYVHDVDAHISTSFDMPTVGTGAASGGTAISNPDFIIDHCLFHNISLDGDGEIINTKTSNIKIRFTTWTNNPNSFLNAPRMGQNMEIRSCWFEANRVNFCRGYSNNLLVIGNRFIGNNDLLIGAGTEYFTTGDGSGNEAVRNGRVIGNVLDSGQILVGNSFLGQGPQAEPWDTPVLNTNICPPTGPGANTRASGAPVHLILTLPGPPPGGAGAVGTTFNASNSVARPDEAFVPAQKLTPGDVGVGAGDPLCPSGPQS